MQTYLNQLEDLCNSYQISSQDSYAFFLLAESILYLGHSASFSTQFQPQELKQVQR